MRELGRFVIGVLVLLCGGVAVVSAYQGDWGRATFFAVVVILCRQEFMADQSPS